MGYVSFREGKMEEIKHMLKYLNHISKSDPTYLFHPQKNIFVPPSFCDTLPSFKVRAL